MRFMRSHIQINLAWLEEARRLIKVAKYWVERISRWCEEIEAAIDELERMKTSIKNGKTLIDFEEALEVIAKNNKLAAEALRSAKVERFDLGRLWVSHEDAEQASMLNLMSGLIRRALFEHYKVKFRMRILRDSED